MSGQRAGFLGCVDKCPLWGVELVKLMREAVMVDYIAKIKPINADKIETQAHGIATFSENGNSLHIHVEMFDTPANIEHWEHSP